MAHEPRPLLLVGAGGLAREVVHAVGMVNQHGRQWKLLGYLDDSPALSGRTVAGLPVLGPVSMLPEHPSAQVLVCVASPDEPLRRQRLVHRLALPDERYASLVHPTAVLAPDTQLGVGSVVLAQVVATAGVSIGRHVVVMPATVLTHDDVVDDFVTVAAGVRVAGGVRIATGAYLGAGALIKESLTIGSGALVGMGAVVTRDIASDAVAVGTPARSRERSPSPPVSVIEAR
jgi:sugar O-acyltransferase (sialic acid O-acetyltransferase NeuD family)